MTITKINRFLGKVLVHVEATVYDRLTGLVCTAPVTDAALLPETRKAVESARTALENLAFLNERLVGGWVPMRDARNLMVLASLVSMYVRTEMEPEDWNALFPDRNIVYDPAFVVKTFCLNTSHLSGDAIALLSKDGGPEPGKVTVETGPDGRIRIPYDLAYLTSPAADGKWPDEVKAAAGLAVRHGCSALEFGPRYNTSGQMPAAGTGGGAT